MKKIITTEEIGLKIGDNEVVTYDCAGTVTISSTSISKTKKCGATEEVVAVVVTGAGNITAELHVDADDMAAMFGINGTAKGIAVKQGKRRPDVEMTIKGTDEEEDEMLFAIPLAKVTSDEVNFVDLDNGSTDISYTSVELAYRPDSNKIGVYGIEVDDLPSDVTEDAFLTAFDTNKAKVLAAIEGAS